MARINSRSKGIRGERDVIDRLQPVVNEVFALFNKQAAPLQRNTLQYDDGGSDIAGLDFLALEVKNCATLQLKQWWEQCVAQAEKANKHQTPVLIYKAGRGVHRVRMWGQTLSQFGDGAGCCIDIDWDAFLVWFRNELFGYLSTDNQTKQISDKQRAADLEAQEEKERIARAQAYANRKAGNTAAAEQKTDQREIDDAAANWARSCGHTVPRRGSKDFAKMVGYWQANIAAA